MTAARDGGPAFPATRSEIVSQRMQEGSLVNATADVSYSGMSLRDYFAAQVVIGAHQLGAHVYKIAKEDGISGPAGFARYAYELADAMLAERVRS